MKILIQDLPPETSVHSIRLSEYGPEIYNTTLGIWLEKQKTETLNAIRFEGGVELVLSPPELLKMWEEAFNEDRSYAILTTFQDNKLCQIVSEIDSNETN